MSLELTNARGVRAEARHRRDWSGVGVQVTRFRCEATRGWHEITSPATHLNIVLEQIGGRGEPRVKLQHPCPSPWTGPNHVDFVPANLPLWGYFESLRSARSVMVQFDQGTLERLLEAEVSASVLQTPRLRFRGDRLAKLAGLLADESEDPGRLSELYGDSLTSALLVEWFRMSGRAIDEDSRMGLTPVQLRRTLEYLNAHLGDRIRLEDLARTAGLSPSRFGRAFKVSVGVTPHRWLLDVRVARAKQLLLETQLTLTEIAHATGFSEQSHLTRVFRELAGAPPATWARANRR